MKSGLKIIAIFFFFFFTSNLVIAQDKPVKKVETAEFKVTGVCKMCKKRIENAALIKGVKFAEWKKETQILKVIYKPKDVKENAIHIAVAKVGHDTEKVKATVATYKKLPDCCAYRDGVKVH
jgi:hypothetical protein